MLNSGYEMPIIGLGTWTLSDDEAENSVYIWRGVLWRKLDRLTFISYNMANVY